VTLKRTTTRSILGLLLILILASPAPAGTTEELPDSQATLQAMVDEISRSMRLQMEDLDKPYFIQYTVDDDVTYTLSAAYGAITSFDRDRSRRFFSSTRVGTFELDNTNFAGTGGFGRFGGAARFSRGASLPLDEGYTALRQAMWRVTDREYKQAVETLTRKKAYLEDKTIEDRPHDFSKASVVEHIDPPATLDVDADEWKQKLRDISSQFLTYPQLQDSGVQLILGVGNTYVVNTEGTRLRIADTGALLMINAEIQAEDGMRLTSGRSYYGVTPQELPDTARIKADIDELATKLIDASQAPVLESYMGPVLFDAVAAGQVFRRLLSEGLAGNPDPIGGGRRMTMGPKSLEKKLGQRILPKTFSVYDDPLVERVGATALLGHYRYDAEAVRGERVNLVTEGVLENMVITRVPTKKLTGSNGHARRPAGTGTWTAAISSLFIENAEGVSNEDLKDALIAAARDEGLDYGIRIASLRMPGLGSSQADMMSFFRAAQGGAAQGLDDPAFVYKVYVEDGREELVRGCEFGEVKLRDLRDIVAAGNEAAVYNYIGLGFAGTTPPSAIISPAILFEELELTKIEQELDKLPILTSPLAR
jgi:hypothetical protein